jgi:hypothetical protein
LAIRATAAEVQGELFGLLARVGIDDRLTYRHPAVVASVGAIEAGVVDLYGVVVILGRWVRGCARLIHVNLLDRLAGLREILGGLSAGPFLCLQVL